MKLSDLERLKKDGLIKDYVETGSSKKPLKSKYGNEKTQIDGIVFSSKRESNYYFILKTRLLAKEITELKMQVPFQLSVCKYIADFTFYENGKMIVVDVKGFKTKEYNLKKKLMKSELGIDIKEV